MNTNLSAALQQIRSFHLLSPNLGTAGQPDASQFPAIREAGFETVINLALPTSDYAIPDEGRITTSLGMAYVHIPVDFKKPTTQDFNAFCKVMEAFGDRPVFVHCVANIRVATFIFLYRVLRQGIPASEAEKDLHAIWHPDEVWSQFISDQLKQNR